MLWSTHFVSQPPGGDALALLYAVHVTVISHRFPAIKAEHPSVSHADLWTLAGVTAIKYMGGPTVAWSPGRTDSEKPTSVEDGECCCGHLDGFTRDWISMFVACRFVFWASLAEYS